MDNPQAVSEDKDGSLQCLCYRLCTAVRLHARQERRLNTFHLISIRRILGISWEDKVTNGDVLRRACLPSTVFNLLCTLSLANADGYGWVMSAVWRMVAFQKTSSTVSWHWGGDQPAALTCDIKMSATLRDRFEGCRHRHYVLEGPCS